MIDFLLNFFVFILLIISLLGVLVVLMQKTSTQAGMGAALSGGGGGAADQAFGAESATVLTKATQTLTIVFFVLAFALYLGFQARHEAQLKAEEGEGLLPAAVPEQSVNLETVEGAETEVTVQPTEENTPEPQP